MSSAKALRHIDIGNDEYCGRAGLRLWPLAGNHAVSATLTTNCFDKHTQQPKSEHVSSTAEQVAPLAS